VSARPRELETYRPYAAEMPWALLALAGAAADEVADVVAQDLVRVAKLRGEIVAAYGIRPLSATAYQLVTLAVEPAWRGRRYGRWMLGHALGLAESRGGRTVWVRGRAHQPFLARAGFTPAQFPSYRRQDRLPDPLLERAADPPRWAPSLTDADDLWLELTPE